MLALRLLQKVGYAVDVVETGKQALEAVQRKAYRIVLMDVQMPEMDGFEATARIRTLSEPQWIPIILLTALDNDDDLVRGVTSGADDYLVKPFDLAELSARIRAVAGVAGPETANNATTGAACDWYTCAKSK